MSVPKSYISPFLPKFDQERLGTCVPCSYTSCMEIMSMNELQTENVPELSRFYFYGKCKESDGKPNVEGTYVSTANSVARNYGTCLESLVPYDVDKYLDEGFPKFTKEMYDDAHSRRVKSTISTKYIEKIKEHIWKYGACVMEEYFCDMTFEKNILTKIGTRTKGQHLTCLIGYDAEFEHNGKKGAFLRLNGNNPALQYGLGLEIIPFEHFSNRTWFIQAVLLVPFKTSDYLKNKYSGKKITPHTDIIKLRIGSDIAYLNGEEKKLNFKPIIINGTTMVGLRVVDLFRKAYVDWQSATKTAIVHTQTGNLFFKIGRKEILDGYGNVVATAPVEPQLINGSTMIPLRTLGECLGCRVEWNGKTKEIFITN